MWWILSVLCVKGRPHEPGHQSNLLSVIFWRMGGGGGREGLWAAAWSCSGQGLLLEMEIWQEKGAWDEANSGGWGVPGEVEGAHQIAREIKMLRVLLMKKCISLNIKNRCFLSCIWYKISCDMVFFYYTLTALRSCGLGLYHNSNSQEAVFCLAMTPATIVFDLQPLKRDGASSVGGVVSAD